MLKNNNIYNYNNRLYNKANDLLSTVPSGGN